MNESHHHDLVLLLAKCCIKTPQIPLVPELPPVLPLQKEETRRWREKVVCNDAVSMAAGTGVSKLCILNMKQWPAPLNKAFTLEQKGTGRGEPPRWPQVGFFRWV